MWKIYTVGQQHILCLITEKTILTKILPFVIIISPVLLMFMRTLFVKSIIIVLINLFCVQMAGLCWVTVMLVFFLSAENSLAAVNQNGLAGNGDGILKE